MSKLERIEHFSDGIQRAGNRYRNSRAGLLAHAEQHRAKIEKGRFALETRISRWASFALH
jgi:hypothetical protein